MNYVKESILKQLRKEAQQTVQQDQAKYDRLAPKLITNLIGDIGVSDAVTSKSDVPQELFPRDLGGSVNQGRKPQENIGSDQIDP